MTSSQGNGIGYQDELVAVYLKEKNAKIARGASTTAFKFRSNHISLEVETEDAIGICKWQSCAAVWKSGSRSYYHELNGEPSHLVQELPLEHEGLYLSKINSSYPYRYKTLLHYKFRKKKDEDSAIHQARIAALPKYQGPNIQKARLKLNAAETLGQSASSRALMPPLGEFHHLKMDSSQIDHFEGLSLVAIYWKEEIPAIRRQPRRFLTLNGAKDAVLAFSKGANAFQHCPSVWKSSVNHLRYYGIDRQYTDLSKRKGEGKGKGKEKDEIELSATDEQGWDLYKLAKPLKYDVLAMVKHMSVPRVEDSEPTNRRRSRSPYRNPSDTDTRQRSPHRNPSDIDQEAKSYSPVFEKCCHFDIHSRFWSVFHAMFHVRWQYQRAKVDTYQYRCGVPECPDPMHKTLQSFMSHQTAHRQDQAETPPLCCPGCQEIFPMTKPDDGDGDLTEMMQHIYSLHKVEWVLRYTNEFDDNIIDEEYKDPEKWVWCGICVEEKKSRGLVPFPATAARLQRHTDIKHPGKIERIFSADDVKNPDIVMPGKWRCPVLGCRRNPSGYGQLSHHMRCAHKD